MLTKKVIKDCDMTLLFAMIDSTKDGIPNNTSDMMPPFDGEKILFVGDFLQLLPVDRTSAPAFQRMIYQMVWWNRVLIFSLAEPIQCIEFYWFAFLRLLSINHLYIKNINWQNLFFYQSYYFI